ncbi:hypothetical protein FB549_4242 [Delftia sp. HK171]|nr:hypothetical protein FB549_4242 [Delftia sp. HK171]
MSFSVVTYSSEHLQWCKTSQQAVAIFSHGQSNAEMRHQGREVMR